MIWKFDEQLAAEVEEIDLVLAGHDHDYGVKCVSILCEFSHSWRYRVCQVFFFTWSKEGTKIFGGSNGGAQKLKNLEISHSGYVKF